MNSSNHLISPPGARDSLPHRSPAPPLPSDGKQRGVARIQLMRTRRGGVFWILCASLAIFCYLMSLDQQSTGSFRLWAAASPWAIDVNVGTMNAITGFQTLIIAVVTLLFARLADVRSRGMVYGVSLFCYALGYILAASSQSGGSGGSAFLASIVFSIIGRAGLVFITDLVLADITSLQWRGFATALPVLPYTLNIYVSTQFTRNIIEGPGWPWGYGIFAITVPIAIAPALAVLSFTGRREARTREEENKLCNQSFFEQFLSFDPVGLVLIAAIFGLVSYPLQLVSPSGDGLSHPRSVAMIVVGTCCIPLFLLWEWFYSRASLMPRRLLTNRAVICAILLSYFFRLTSAVCDLYAPILITLLRDWPSDQFAWFASMPWISLTFFAVVVGLVVRFVHRYKYITVLGACIRLVALGMQIGASTASVTTGYWFSTDALAGLGGACVEVGTRIGSQASVSHNDLAMVVALVRVWPLLGSSFGQIISRAVYQANHVALAVSQFSGPSSLDDNGYPGILRKLFIIAFSLSILCVVFALLMPNFYLGKAHNLVDESESKTSTGESDRDPAHDANTLEKNSQELRTAAV